MKVKDLTPAKYNPRKITDEKLIMLGKAMKEFGDLSGIVFNIRTKRLIGGHQRYKHLNPEWTIKKTKHHDKCGTVAVGSIQTPEGDWFYREVDWEEKKELAANVAANKHGGEFDFPLLKDLMVELDLGHLNIEITGFTAEELGGLFDYQAPEEDETEEQGDPSTPKNCICASCGNQH